MGTPTATAFNQTSAGYSNPDDPDLRRRLLRSGPQAPGDAHHGVPDAGGWQRGRARAGVALAAVGHPQRALGQPAQHHQRRRQRVHRIVSQRPDQVSDDIYGPGKDASAWNLGSRSTTTSTAPPSRSRRRARWATSTRNVAVGPEFWNVDLAVSKLVSVVGTQRLELRLETFNLFNHFNWGNPADQLQRGDVRAHHDAGRRLRASCSSA